MVMKKLRNHVGHAKHQAGILWTTDGENNSVRFTPLAAEDYAHQGTSVNRYGDLVRLLAVKCMR